MPRVVCQPRDTAFFEGLGAVAVAAPGIERVSRRLVWEQTGLPRLARELGVDLVHSPHYTFPVARRRGRIVTVHDLTFFTLPEVHSRLKRLFFSSWIRSAARRRLPVIADSHATEREFIEIVHALPATITVSHLGYDADKFHSPDAASSASLRAAVPDLPERWIAFLGTLEPRKNVVALIEGYRHAVATLENPPALLLAGGDGWDPEVAPAIERAVAAGLDVRKLGYLPLDALSAFLGESALFAYPSLGEGFGLPVLEAMATGACVLTTDRLSLPEVGGDAVAYTEVDAAAIGDSIHSLLVDDARRAALGAAGLARAAQFSWDAAATRHRAAYTAAVAA